ncbi:MAG: right-handed parallel beta-helix repeat-containing protein [Elusimicrobiota bacterium]
MATARGGYLRRDETWDGDNVIVKDVVVPRGAILRLASGCRLWADTNSELPAALPLEPRGRRFLDEKWGRRLLVLGSLEAAGTVPEPVRLDLPSPVGLLILGAGRARLDHVVLEAAEGFAVCADDFSSVTANDASFSGGLGSVLCAGFARAVLRRCRISRSARAGLELQDHSRARLSLCAFESCRSGVLLEGHSSCCLRASVFSGNDSGVDAVDSSRLRGAGVSWRGNAAGCSLKQQSRADVRGGEFSENGVALEAVGLARVRLQGAAFRRNKTGLWAQEKARVALTFARFSENETGLRLSQSSRGLGQELGFARHGRCAVHLEQNARLALTGSRFDGDQNGVLALNSCRAELRRCSFSACRDTAIWRDHRSRAAVSENFFSGNGHDFQIETRPKYD